MLQLSISIQIRIHDEIFISVTNSWLAGKVASVSEADGGRATDQSPTSHFPRAAYWRNPLCLEFIGSSHPALRVTFPRKTTQSGGRRNV